MAFQMCITPFVEHSDAFRFQVIVHISPIWFNLEISSGQSVSFDSWKGDPAP